METITKQEQPNEEILLDLIHDFFDCRKLPEHLIFLDYWMEQILINQPHKKYLNPPDLIFFASKFLNLLTACNEMRHVYDENLLYFEESVRTHVNFIQNEQKLLAYYPNYLRTKEICNPILVFHSIFKNHNLEFYKNSLQNWINESLSIKDEPEKVKLIFPTYRNLKRMIEACWLIHERLITKNSYQSSKIDLQINNFESSCPLLLKDEYLSNPYLMIESFFSFARLDEYREDLTQWFKAALNECGRYESANDLLFIHNQFVQIIHAAYLIGTSQFVYQPTTNYTKQHATFGHWLLARMENRYTIQTLSPHFKENPIAYCSENLTLDHVIKIRYGLKEWLEAALSENNSITSLDHNYIFDQFEDLQKILEAVFLLIVAPALADI